MAVIRTLLIILEAACSLALIGLILLQKSKDGGLGMAFGSGGNDSLFGARAGNVLTRATVGIGIVFLVNTLVLGVLFAGSASESMIEKELGAQPVPMEQSAIPQAAPAEMPEIPAMPAVPAQ
ncbi:MAG: preprotein translocase subunit SecG [Kiritimatiellales bacterium]|nr:preprotein translocase subunit SecG [Kiritimatiellales bacterium]